jgi:ABC-type multidrug transport system fused ATPase/permease subunit
MDLRRRLIAGYEALRERHPAEVDRLADRVRGYDERIASAGLSHRHPSRLTVGMVLSYTTGTLVGLLALAPFAIPGFLVNYPAYRLIGFIASRAASADEEEVVATYKWLGSMLLFPLSWALVTVAVGLRVDWLIAVAALVASPVTAFAALLFAEKVAKLGRGARLVALALFRPTRRDLLIAERREIRDEILALAALLDETPPDAVSGSRAGEERDGEKGGSPSP